MGVTRVVIDPARLATFLRSPDGPVLRHIIVQAERVKAAAQDKVGVYQGDTSRRDRKPGTLRDSIVKRVVAGGPEGVMVLVGSDDEIALIHHEGTPPHPIDPVKGSVLVFMAAGTLVFARHVDHPGTKPNPFLLDALHDVFTHH